MNMGMIGLAQTSVERRPLGRAQNDTLVIGFVNNMAGAAAVQSERQFRTLMQAAAPDKHIFWRRYALPGSAREFGTADLRDAPLPDALIVTGAEPRSSTMQDEPFWPGLCGLLDWAEERAIPLLLSCLAAHAALLYAEGIVRQPLAVKRSGVFAYHPVADHALLRGLPGIILTPHSRRNVVPAAALRKAGCTILTSSFTGEVDMALREGTSSWLLLQGHPEYEAGTLLLEYRRDLLRYLAGGASVPMPEIPSGHLDPAAEARLRALEPKARIRALSHIIQAHPTKTPWLQSARTLFTSWLDFVSEARSTRASSHIHL